MAIRSPVEAPGKEDAQVLQIEHQPTTDIDFTLMEEGPGVPYRMTWRTYAGVLALGIAWGSSTFAITGPNSTIGNVVTEYPESAANASWIANGPLFCLVTLPSVIGAAGDRYGKRWFIIAGTLIGMIGAIIASFATSMAMVIGGQTLTGAAGTCLVMSVASGMEIVPARHRLFVVSAMAMINSSLGGLGGIFTFSACVEHGLGWRWGYKIMACLYAFCSILLGIFYRPPPTRFRREATIKQLLKSIDFLGIFLLSLGAALLTVALVWGGTAYPWNSTHVIPFLIVGPLVLIGFGVYEWRGRNDGILHHAFFESISFPIFIVFGFVDGMILYGFSVFIPNELNAVYYTSPLGVARGNAAFNGCLMAGFLIIGYVSSKTKQFRWPLVASSVFLTLFCGLTARSVPSDKGYFIALTGLCGLATAATEVIPVAGIALVVPNHLLGTSNQVLGTFRALGGALGIAIATSVYNNKVATLIPNHVTPVLVEAGVPPAAYGRVFTALFTAPMSLGHVLDVAPDVIQSILAATAEAAAQGYAYFWYVVMGSATACLILAFFIKDSPHTMTEHIESALESRRPELEEKQPANV